VKFVFIVKFRSQTHEGCANILVQQSFRPTIVRLDDAEKFLHKSEVFDVVQTTAVVKFDVPMTAVIIQKHYLSAV
jgi:hypothetical protein